MYGKQTKKLMQFKMTDKEERHRPSNIRITGVHKLMLRYRHLAERKIYVSFPEWKEDRKGLPDTRKSCLQTITIKAHSGYVFDRSLEKGIPGRGNQQGRGCWFSSLSGIAKRPEGLE